MDDRTDERTIDAITGGWTIAQRRRGHRHSTDDLMTGWYAAEIVREAHRVSGLLGAEGIDALTRILGFLLVCVGIQFIAVGIGEFVEPFLPAARAAAGV